MAYSNDIKKAAMELRKKGYSLKELSDRFHIAKATASLWSSDIPLNKKAKKRILAVKRRGQLVGAQSRRARTKAIEKTYFDEALLEIQSAPDYNKIFCAMIYWCEGRKKQMGWLLPIPTQNS
jgi:orotate phosphoribosyltransferase-like protein